MKRLKSRNQGYSLPELIIVVSIMMIIAAMSFVTFRMVDNAKYKQAVSTFESELSTLRDSTMAQDASMALMIYQDASDKKYYIKRGYVDKETGLFTALSHDAGEDTPPTSNPGLLDLQYYSYSGLSNPVTVLPKGSILYNDMDITEDGVVIQFNKSDGSIDAGKGAGKFTFRKKNDEIIADVNIVPSTGVYFESY